MLPSRLRSLWLPTWYVDRAVHWLQDDCVITDSPVSVTNNRHFKLTTLLSYAYFQQNGRSNDVEEQNSKSLNAISREHGMACTRKNGLVCRGHRVLISSAICPLNCLKRPSPAINKRAKYQRKLTAFCTKPRFET